MSGLVWTTGALEGWWLQLAAVADFRSPGPLLEDLAHSSVWSSAKVVEVTAVPESLCGQARANQGSVQMWGKQVQPGDWEGSQAGRASRGRPKTGTIQQLIKWHLMGGAWGPRLRGLIGAASNARPR